MVMRVKSAEVRELWRRYKSSGDSHAREKLVRAYSPLVRYTVARVASTLPRHIDVGAFTSCGFMGLLSAIDRFDPSHKIKFESYALTRVRYAILDELRATDWVPRTLRARAREIERTRLKLGTALQRLPTEGEMAAELCVDRQELRDTLMRIANSRVVSIDQNVAASDFSDDELPLLDTLLDSNASDPAEVLDAADLKERVAGSMARLPERERLTIALHYYDELSFREISEVFGISDSHASRLHANAILRLGFDVADGVA